MNINKLSPFKDLENINKSIENLDIETLKQTLSFLIKVYVLEKGIGYEGNILDNIDDSQIAAVKSVSSSNSEKINSFSELIIEFKKSYAFNELNNFVVENGKVYFLLNGRKQLISNESTTPIENKNVQSVSIQQNADTSQKSSPERFKNIEMDK
jgi:hypothetical protein